MKQPNPTPYGANATLDDMYEQLGSIEARELDAIEFGRIDLLPEIRRQMLPLKRIINQTEGITIYPEAE